MNSTGQHIYSNIDSFISREEKEELLGQRAKVLWFTGLSGAGKSTLVAQLEKRLYLNRYKAAVLDGDSVRNGLNYGLGFSEEDRLENIRRVAEVSKLFTQNGIITLCSFVSPMKTMRDMAKKIIGESDFLEIYIDAPLELCEQRDVKGLYAKARAGVIKDLTGVGSPFEAPEHPFLRVDTAANDIDTCGEIIYSAVLPLIRREQKHG